MGGVTPKVVGMAYTFPTEDHSTFEAGADLFSDGRGTFFFGYRYTLRPLELFRPFVRGGAGLKSDGAGGLGELIKLDNFRARATAGFEHFFLDPFSYRVEAQYSIGKSESGLHFKAGLTWAWY